MKRIPISIGILLVIAAVATTGCEKNQDGAQSSAKAQNSQTETMVISSGTNIVVSLEIRISTETSHSGDSFSARTTEPVMVNGKTAVPTGTLVHGLLQNVQASGRASGRAQMTLAYQGIDDSDGNTCQLSAQPLALQAASATGGDVEKIAAGTVLGAVVGGIAGGGKGAAIGAGAGAGAGTILMLATQGDEVVLKAGQRLNVQLTSSANIANPTGK